MSCQVSNPTGRSMKPLAGLSPLASAFLNSSLARACCLWPSWAPTLTSGATLTVEGSAFMETQALLLEREIDGWQAKTISGIHCRISDNFRPVKSPRCVAWPGHLQGRGMVKGSSGGWWKHCCSARRGEEEWGAGTTPNLDLSLPSKDAKAPIVSGTFVGRSLFF